MRPVNLIPPEERRGESAPTRSGPLAYIFVGALVLILAGVTGLTLLNKQVSDAEANVAELEDRAAESGARAASLASYTSFQSIRDARVATVNGLATSRFDWERVLRELSRVLPENIWLTNLQGTVSPDVQLEGGDDASGLRSQIPGPALVLTGCGRTHSDVARLVAAMEDIDGVTRVTASDSAKPAASGGGATAGGASGGGSCQTRPNIPQFHLVAAFDELSAGAAAPASAADPATPASATAPPAAPADPATDPGTPSAAQQAKVGTATSIPGAGG